MADLHRMVRSILDTMLSDGAEVLVCGAGGGRELVTLGESERSYRLVGIDTCADMIGLARHALAGTSAEGRTNFIQAAPEDLPRQIYDAATSLFVMHFLPDDGAKTTYLAAIRQRLRPGAPYLHVDACYPGDEAGFRIVSPFYRGLWYTGFWTEAA
jgi:tRNA (cmo5U34)-methyltransferase